MGEARGTNVKKGDTYSVSVGRPERKRRLGRPKHRREYLYGMAILLSKGKSGRSAPAVTSGSLKCVNFFIKL